MKYENKYFKDMTEFNTKKIIEVIGCKNYDKDDETYEALAILQTHTDEQVSIDKRNISETFIGDSLASGKLIEINEAEFNQFAELAFAKIFESLVDYVQS